MKKVVLLLLAASINSAPVVLKNETTNGCRKLELLFKPPPPPIVDVDDNAGATGRRSLDVGIPGSPLNQVCRELVANVCPLCATAPLDQRAQCAALCAVRFPAQFVAAGCTNVQPTTPPKKDNEFATIDDCRDLVKVACESCVKFTDFVGRATCIARCYEQNKVTMYNAGCRPANASAPVEQLRNGTLDRCTNLFVRTCGFCKPELEGRNLCAQDCFSANKTIFIAARCLPPRPPSGFDESRLEKIRIKVNEIIEKLPAGSVTVDFAVGDSFSIKVEAQFPVAYQSEATEPTAPDETTGASTVEFTLTTSSDSKAYAKSSTAALAATAATAVYYSGNNQIQKTVASGIFAGFALSSMADAQDTCPIQVKVTVTTTIYAALKLKAAAERYEIKTRETKSPTASGRL